MNNTCVCLICYKPNDIWINFLSKFIKFDIYIVIDDNSTDYTGQYSNFSNINIILILIQLYIVYTNISSDSFEKTGKMSKVTSSVVYLLGVLSTITSIILYTILRYFTTDGFTTNN
jgi:hypothetical protein